MRRTSPGILVVALLAAANTAAANPTAAPASHEGVVLDRIAVDAYVYVRLDIGTRTLWAAGPKVPVQVGQRAAFVDALPMDRYYSKGLGITFDRVYFAEALKLGASAPAGSSSARAPAAAPPAAPVDFSSIQRPPGGRTVAELLAEGSPEGNQEVVLRARVVKVVHNVMDRSWIHLRDGTGAEGANDLTVTSKDAQVAVGDLVLVRGVLIRDKDFGYGYRYARIIEDARITRE